MAHTASFGRYLSARRHLLDLTQEELARRVGCSVVTIRKLEADERRPSKQIAERLAPALALPDGERAAFISAARAQLALDRLAAPPEPALQLQPSAKLPTGTLTFLFTDIEGSTRLWEQHPQAMQLAL